MSLKQCVSSQSVDLNVDTSHPWSVQRYGDITIAFAGYLFNASETDLLNVAKSDASNVAIENLVELTSQLDGHFAFAITGADWAFAAVDRVRSIPLFLAQLKGVWTIDNRADRLRRAAGLGHRSIDPESVRALSMSGYTIDRTTLYRELMMLGPGECAGLRGGSGPQRHRYYTYRPWLVRSFPRKKTTQRLADLTLAVMQKHLKSLSGRPLAIPLSAGNDSRLIASAAHHLGYKNVFCFAYGRAENFESTTSRHIAERLGYKWEFAPLTIAGQRNYFSSQSYRDYIDYADSCASVPFVQDGAALVKLKASGFLPDDAVIANGNSGDFISGNHINPRFHKVPDNLSDEDRIDRVINSLIEKHFALWTSLSTPDRIASLRRSLERSLRSAGAALGPPETDHGLHEYAEFQDRQCKYVITGQRTYEFLGHDWRLPLWDNDYLDFWQSIPLEFKVSQNLYTDMLHCENWGHVWQNVPVNAKTIRPKWIIPVRLLAKLLHAPLGANRWHRFERRALQYWMDVTCSSACVPYRKTLFDNRGARHAISWLTELYLARHGLTLNGSALDFGCNETQAL